MTKASARRMTLAVHAWVEILGCRARLRLPRLLRAESFLRREIAAAPRDTAGGRGLDGLLAAFDRALRAQPGVPGCLPRSLALRRFLARHGHGARLALGLRRTSGRRDGHAWVEAGGAVVTRDVDFTRTFLPLRRGSAGLSLRGSCDA